MNQFVDVQEQVKLRTVVVSWKRRGKDGLKGTFSGYRNILYCERGVCYSGMFDCQNTVAKICHFNLCKF